MSSESFKQSYLKLKEIAEKIKNQQDPDIDALVPMVDDALLAYADCKTRLANVKAALGEKLPVELPA